jgi:cell division protein FtsB
MSEPIKKFTTTSPLTQLEILNAEETLKLLNEIIDGVNPLFEQITELQKNNEELCENITKLWEEVGISLEQRTTLADKVIALESECLKLRTENMFRKREIKDLRSEEEVTYADHLEEIKRD